MMRLGLAWKIGFKEAPAALAKSRWQMTARHSIGRKWSFRLGNTGRRPVFGQLAINMFADDMEMAQAHLLEISASQENAATGSRDSSNDIVEITVKHNCDNDDFWSLKTHESTRGIGWNRWLLWRWAKWTKLPMMTCKAWTRAAWHQYVMKILRRWAGWKNEKPMKTSFYSESVDESALMVGPEHVLSGSYFVQTSDYSRVTMQQFWAGHDEDFGCPAVFTQQQGYSKTTTEVHLAFRQAAYRFIKMRIRSVFGRTTWRKNEERLQSLNTYKKAFFEYVEQEVI